MTTGQVPRNQQATTSTPGHQPDRGHLGHGWLMMICCMPMLVIAVILVATGVAGAGTLLVAIGCTAMMAMMMGGMNHGGRDGPHR